MKKESIWSVVILVGVLIIGLLYATQLLESFVGLAQIIPGGDGPSPENAENCEDCPNALCTGSGNSQIMYCGCDTNNFICICEDPVDCPGESVCVDLGYDGGNLGDAYCIPTTCGSCSTGTCDNVNMAPGSNCLLGSPYTYRGSGRTVGYQFLPGQCKIAGICTDLSGVACTCDVSNMIET